MSQMEADESGDFFFGGMDGGENYTGGGEGQERGGRVGEVLS